MRWLIGVWLAAVADENQWSAGDVLITLGFVALVAFGAYNQAWWLPKSAREGRCPKCGAPPKRPLAAKCSNCGTPAKERGSKPWTGKDTRLAPGAAISQLVSEVTSRGAQVTTQSATTLTGTFTVRKRVDMITALVLFVLCVVPFVIYLMAQSRPDVYVWSIEVAPDSLGSRVNYSAQGPAAPLIYQAIAALP